MPITILDGFKAGPFSDAPSLLIGFAKNLNQLFLVNRGSGNNFLSKWNTSTQTLDVNHVATITDFWNSTRPSGFICDDDGQVYGAHFNGFGKWDANISLLHTVSTLVTFPESVYYAVTNTAGGTRYVYGLSDSLVFGCDGSGTGFTAIGKIGWPSNISSSGGFGIVVDKNDNVWALGSVTLTNNGNAQIKKIDPSGGVNLSSFYLSTNDYTVSGAVYGQPRAMLYCASDNSLVFFTATGQLVKWDIGTTSIASAIDISVNVNGGQNLYVQSASRFNGGADILGNVWLPGNDNKTVYVYNLATLALVVSYDVTSFSGSLGAWAEFSGMLSDAGYVVAGITAPNNYWEFLQVQETLQAVNRMIFVMT